MPPSPHLHPLASSGIKHRDYIHQLYGADLMKYVFVNSTEAFNPERDDAKAFAKTLLKVRACGLLPWLILFQSRFFP